MTERKKPKRHGHRQSVWVIAGAHNTLLWCYRCGAIWTQSIGWKRPTGPEGRNPA
jgi:hypothetical protein